LTSLFGLDYTANQLPVDWQIRLIISISFTLWMGEMHANAIARYGSFLWFDGSSSMNTGGPYKPEIIS